MRKINIVLIIFVVLTSCVSHKTISYKDLSESYAKYRTSKPIKLDTIINTDSNYIEFENRSSLIVLKPTRLVSLARIWLIHDSLCLQKQKDIKSLIDKVENKTTGFYLIESMTTPDEYKRLDYPSYSQYKKDFINPYGFKLVVDTTNKVRLNELKNWMISKMCISGDCMVLDKRIKTFVDSIHYDIVDFKDGHGGETLVFKDKKPFYSVMAYTDVIWPDFECMSTDEISAFWDSLRKNRENLKQKNK